MSAERLLNLSERWFRLLQRLYPPDFRDEMCPAVVETYRDRAREALNAGGIVRLAVLWMRAAADSLRNGPGERLRPAVSWRRNGNWGRDGELAIRRLLRAPALVISVVGTLTVGLGLFAVVYTVVQKILFEQMPYQDPNDLYYVWRDYGPIQDLKRGMLSGPDVAELQKAGGIIEASVGIGRQLQTFAAGDGTDATEIAVMFATPNLFDVLGVQPALGRGFAAGDVGPGRSPTIVLTHELWNRLGASPAIIGTDIRLQGQPCTVIGILPPAFTFARNEAVGPPQRADAYVTFNINLAEGNPASAFYSGLIRVRRGTSPEVVASAVNAVGRVVDERDFQGRGLKLYPVALKSDLVSGVRPALLVLGAASVLLLFVLAVNLASVLLARAAQREHEFAVSRALGANGVAIVRATLLEGGLLGLIGGVAAALAATWGTSTLMAVAPMDLPRRDAVAVDWSIGAVVVGVGLLLGLLGAAAPAVWAARVNLSSILASSAVRGGGGQGHFRRGMVVTQVALSLVLLATGGLVVRSFERLLQAAPGFRPHGLVSVRVRMPPEFVPKPADVIVLQDRVEATLAGLPGVTGVSAASALPLTSRVQAAFSPEAAAAAQSQIRFPRAPGNTGDADRDAPLVDVIGTRANYVEVMGMRLVAGRTFDRLRHEGVREALIDRALATQFFPRGNPVGAAVIFRDRPLAIVGVVEQAHLYEVHRDGRPQLYVRAEDWGYRPLFYVMRTTRDASAMIPEVRSAILRIDPHLVPGYLQTMDEVLDHATRRQHIMAVVISGFAVGALLLAAMGLFGIVSASVTRRRHELALRLAVGADHGRVLRLVLLEGAGLVAMGMLIGAPGIYIAGQLIRGVLVDVSPTDPATLLMVALGLGLVAMIACYVPARRVLGIDPALSLRME